MGKDDCTSVGLDIYECGRVVYGGLWALLRRDSKERLKLLIEDRINSQLEIDE